MSKQPSPLTTAELILESDMTEARVHQIASGDVAVFSAKSPDKEGVNEDAVAVIPVAESSAVLAIADGLGGHASGKHAACLAVKELEEAVLKKGVDTKDLREAILNGIECANKAILDLRVGAATTLAVVEVQDHIVRPYHVGDSLILVTGQRGKIKLQTVPHSPVGYAIESGLLDENEAMEHAERHVVSNVIGAEDMRIEIGANLKMQRHDTLIIASDGLYDNLTVEEVAQGIRKGAYERIMAPFIQEARDRMNHPQENRPSKPDDMSFILFRLH